MSIKEKFSTMAWYTKLGIVAGVMGSIGTIATFLGITIPQPVWADEFNEFKEDFYIEQLDEKKEDLRDVKMAEYKIIQRRETVPDFIVEEKLQLEDKIQELEKKIDKLREVNASE